MRKKMFSGVPAFAFAATAVLIFSTSAANAAGDAELKDAFDAGINSALLVIKHEKSLTGKPVPQGFCVSVLSDGHGQIDPFRAIKLESLALNMHMPSPMYLRKKTSDGQTSDTLCFGLVKGPKSKARALLRKIREGYPRIDEYHPEIVLLENPGIYKHALPGAGILYSDSSAAIGRMADRIAELKGKLSEARKELQKEIERKRKAIAIISGKDGADLSTLAKKTKKTKKEGRSASAPKKSVEPKPKKSVRPARKKPDFKIIRAGEGGRVLIKIPEGGGKGR